MNKNMMFIFEDKNGELYDSPDSYVLSLPHRTIEWGAKLKIHPVYYKGSSVYHGCQTIEAMFFHEGSTSSLDGTYWVCDGNWYNIINNTNNIERIDTGSVIRFDMGTAYPKYFKSANDLSWYISNIYPLDKIQITDEMSLYA